jgi:hypothetical protein
MNKIKIILLLVTTAFLMTACVDKEKNKLDNRVKDYWEAKIAKDFKKSYTFLTPGWRKTENEDVYSNRLSDINIKWMSMEFKSKTCTKPTVCSVGVLIKYSYKFPTGGGNIETDTVIKENWLLIDNVWYNLPKKV